MTSIPGIIFAFGGWIRRLSPTGRWRLVLGIVALVLGLIVVFAAKPWDITANAGSSLKLKDIVRMYSWWAALMNLGGILLLLGICPWWTRPVGEENQPRVPLPRWFWPLVAVAMLITAGCASLRMNHSLWDDEEYALRRGVLGAYRQKGGNPPVLDRLTWQETFFAYKKPTNHVFYSILARLTLGARSFVVPAGHPYFSEWVYRMPAYLAGIISVAALALLLADFGFAGAGVVAAFLLALHPWHLRYASEARGYSLILLLVPLLLLTWKRGMESGKWPAWAAFGALQFILLHTWPGMLYLLLIVNLLTLIVFLLRRTPGKWAGRWFVSTALAGMLAVQLMLPLMPQMLAYLREKAPQMAFFAGERCRVIFGHLALGAPWKLTGDGTYPEIFPGILSNTGLATALGISALVLIFGGALLFAKRGTLALVACTVLLLAPLLSGLHAWWRNFPVFEWYFVYGILGICAFAGVALVWLGERLAALCQFRWMAVLPAVAAITGYGILSHPVRDWHLRHPLQQIRESVASTRPLAAPLDPSQESIMTVGFVIPPHVYDARVVIAKSPQKFFNLLRRADAENRPLYVNVGHPWAANRECPVQWAAIHDATLFEPPVMFRGLDSGLDRVVAKYRPGGVATYQFSSEPIPLPAGSWPGSARDD